MSAHRYWRVLFHSCPGGQTGFGNIIMAESVGGANVATDPTKAFANNSYGSGVYQPSNSFDGGTTRGWLAPGGTGWLGNWIAYDFGANPRDIKQLRMLPHPDQANASAFIFDIESSEDGLIWGFEWTGVYTAWVAGTRVTFNRPTVQVQNRYWGILVEQTQNGNRDLVLPELQMALASGGANIVPTAGGVPTFYPAGPFPAVNAFDGDVATECYVGIAFSGSVALYDFGAGNAKAIAEMSVIASISGNGNETRAPTVGRLVYSQDGKDWAIGGLLNASGWSAGQKKSFAVSIVPVEIHSEQAQVLAIYNVPTKEMRTTAAQMFGTYRQVSQDMEVTQASAMVVHKGRVGNPRLRDFTFTLDGHDFYVIQLGENGTLVFDVSSEQWIEWTSEDFVVWRVNTGMTWIGANAAANQYGSSVVLGDDQSGVLWLLDPQQPYDDHPDATSPVQQLAFTRIVTAQAITRGREVVPCYAVFLDGDNYGITATDFEPGVTLETSDDQGRTWFSHGTIGTAPDYNADNYYEWTSLGQISSPGRIFRITDNGLFTRLGNLDMNDAG